MGYAGIDNVELPEPGKCNMEDKNVLSKAKAKVLELDTIILVGDIVSETSDTIFDSIWEDNYDAYYVAMSTENLVGLDVDELHSIADLSVLKRIRDSRQDLLCVS